jgi:large conductance mechanosensitive channel
MGILKEFRDFAVRGNMVDMAVGIVVGAAFGKIVSSLVADVIMPPLGVLLGGVDFRGLRLTLVPASGEVAAVTLNYGQFVQHVVDFLIVAAAIFVVVKAINTLKRAEEAAPAAPPRQEVLLEEIRDLLRPR